MYSTYTDSTSSRAGGTGQSASGSIRWMELLGLRPVPEHRQMYGTGAFIPRGWARHRLSYPRHPAPVLQQMYCVPRNSPKFPRNDFSWMYAPPAEQDF